MRRRETASPRMRARVYRPLRGERGSVLVFAMIAMFIVATLSTVAIAVSIDTNTGTRRDSNYKNAAEAAEAGLQVALYRINMLNPSSTNCVGDAVAAPATSTGLCQSSTYALGNGATYQYYTSPALGSGATCVGLSITSSDVSQRCITATGTANGVIARSQIRAAAFAATPLFPTSGLVGLNSVSLSGSATIVGSASSNGAITSSGSSSAQGIDLGPAGSFTSSSSVSSGSVTHLPSPIVLSPVNPGTSNQTSIANCPARQAAGYTSCNDDFRITNGVANPVVAPYDPSSGITWSPSARVLTLSGGATLTLGGGLYNFCSLTLSGPSSITVAAGVQAEVFIDSPSDPGSGCASNTGTLTMSGGSSWVNLSENPLALQLYVYGNSSGTSSVTYSGSANFYGTLYAPQSSVTISGTGKVIGGIAGKTVTVSGSGANWDSRVGTLQATTMGLYYRTGWAQCSPTIAAGAAPGSGCG